MYDGTSTFSIISSRSGFSSGIRFSGMVLCLETFDREIVNVEW